MKCMRIMLGMVALAITSGIVTAWADDPVTTPCRVTKATPAGTGPFTISAEGMISLSADEKSFLGVQYYVLELAKGGDTYFGFINLPDGPPVPGMPAKQVTGSSPPFPRKGDYRVVFTMQYLDKNFQVRTISAIKDVTVE